MTNQPPPVPITHPAWCDRELCTAPEVLPTMDEYESAPRPRPYQQHCSARLAAIYLDNAEQEIYLKQPAGAPWECDTMLAIGTYNSVRLGSQSALLWAVLDVADELRRKYPLVMDSEAARRAPGSPEAIISPDLVAALLPLEPRDTDAGPSPLAGAAIAGEREPAEIVIGGGLYGDPELDGAACILCHQAFAVGEASVPAGVIDGGPQVFAHHLCLGILHAPMPGYATRMTRCGVPMSRGSGVGPRTVLNLVDVTCIECQAQLAAEWAPKAAAEDRRELPTRSPLTCEEADEERCP